MTHLYYFAITLSITDVEPNCYEDSITYCTISKTPISLYDAEELTKEIRDSSMYQYVISIEELSETEANYLYEIPDAYSLNTIYDVKDRLTSVFSIV